MTTTPDLALSANLNDLYFATLNINGQSTKVEAPPPINPVDDDDDFIDDEDDVLHDLADSDNEVLTNFDDDNEVATVMSKLAKQSVRWVMVVTVLVTHSSPFTPGSGFERGRGRGDRNEGMKGMRQAIRIIELKKPMENYGPQKIYFEWKDQKTMLHVDKNAA
ncbi:hypothetical protein Tco_0711782 [Tanacetum coccineum]